MARRARQRKLHKPHEKRIDLTPYQRLIRFVRWMTPELTPEGALHMLPESDGWTEWAFRENARRLADSLAQSRQLSHPLPALIPYIVTGAWGWPVNTSGHVQGTVSDDELTLPLGEQVVLDPRQLSLTAIPRLLKKELPTVGGLCQLANDLREVLGRLVAGDDEGVWEVLNEETLGRVIRTVELSRTRGEPAKYQLEDQIADLDFSTYCFWLLTQLLVEGHAWRVTVCAQCEGFFLKVRRDPPGRPSRFCSEQCRRAWHNPRRPRKGGRA